MAINSFPSQSASQARKHKTLLIVWHSRTGAAQQMAQAASQGALDILQELRAEDQVDCILMQASQTTPDHLLQASALLFCCPENLAGISGEMNEFFDRCYYPVLDQLNGLPYALMVSAGTDGTGAIRQMQRICTGWRLREAAPPLLIRTGAQTPQAILAPKNLPPDELEACATLGATLTALIA